MGKKASEFGIYFGSEKISVTEVQAGKAVFNFSLPQERVVTAETEQKLPDEIKIEAALRAEFKKNKLLPEQVKVALAGEDLIIRTFDLPIFLSNKELKSGAIAFEAKKYIPFKIAELEYDFRIYPDRKNKRILALFIGIKKEILNKYLFVFKQLNIEVKLMEYAGFSILRLLRLSGIDDKGFLGLLSVDLEEETNFIVCQNGFPLFSRDITLSSKAESQALDKEESARRIISKADFSETVFLDRLKSEIRISLDFFRRKFSANPLEKIIILSSPKIQGKISSLIADLGLSLKELDISKNLSNDLAFNSGLAKSFATAIRVPQKYHFPIDLLKPSFQKEKEGEGETKQASFFESSNIKINPKIIVVSILIVVLIWGYGFYKIKPLEKKLRDIQKKEPNIAGVPIDKGLQEISKLEASYIEKNNVIDKLIVKREYFTNIMNLIAQVIPRGAWLTSLSFHSGKKEITLKLQGIVYLGHADKEFSAVNDMIVGLKNNPKFNKRFSDIQVLSMDRIVSSKLGLDATSFVISCSSK